LVAERSASNLLSGGKTASGPSASSAAKATWSRAALAGLAMRLAATRKGSKAVLGNANFEQREAMMMR
jgi:hypothetical protein